MENLPSLADAIATARLICPGAGVAVSPVTLASRLGPYPGGEPGPGDPPADVDLRGHALFGASWTLGAIGWLAREHPDSVTLYETNGPRGIVERTAGPAVPGVPATSGAVFPVLHVLADLAGRRDDELVDVDSSDPLAVSALALARCGRAPRARRQPQPGARSVRIDGLPAGGVRCRLLDERSAGPAMDDPIGYAAEDGVHEATADGTLDLELVPYAIVRIDGLTRVC